jgi:16S rRNA (cytidine1402-2'-O)-methyltransferase
MSAPASDASLDPGLYLVATPIGNLEDITLRALRVLRMCDRIYAEDTRRTRVLLTAHELRTPLRSLPAFSEERRLGTVLDDLQAGMRVALCTDAGTPGVSDPGAATVRAARQANLPVHVIPGPSAVTAAIAGSGISSPAITFLGFLPRSPGKLRRTVADACVPGHSVIFFESPQRLGRTLTLLNEVIGDRPAVVARELTKLHETWHQGTVAELAAEFSAAQTRGEITVVIPA